MRGKERVRSLLVVNIAMYFFSHMIVMFRNFTEKAEKEKNCEDKCQPSDDEQPTKKSRENLPGKIKLKLKFYCVCNV